MVKVIAALVAGLALGFVVGHLTAPKASGATACGTDPAWETLSPPPWAFQNPVARWCTPDRPFAVTVIDRTSSEHWHGAIQDAAVLWTASGHVSVSVTAEAGGCEARDGISIVVCNYHALPGSEFGSEGWMQQEFLDSDVRYMTRPIVHFNDYWPAWYLEQGYTPEQVRTHLARGAVGHELGHGLGLWHPAVPLPSTYCGTMGGGGCGPAGDFSMLRTLYGSSPTVTPHPTPSITQTASPTPTTTPKSGACWPPRAKRCR